MPSPSVITIGNFDGVHVGHAALVRRAREMAGAHRGARVVAMTFDPHPLSRLRPESCPARLTTFERKSALLREAGADEVVRLRPDEATLGLTPEGFIDRVLKDRAPVAFVEGPTFRFGHDRAGDVRRLRELGERAGFAVEVLAPVEVTLTDCTVAPATSSLARWLIEQGRVGDGGAVLGRPYAIDGVVERGDRVGRDMGLPTANVVSECLTPGDGVYAGWADVPDGRRLAAAISVGSKPTFGERERAVEALLLDGSGRPASLAGVPEYGWAITLGFNGWIRDQVRFPSVPALVEQIGRDCRRVREILARGAELGLQEAARCR